MPATGCIVGAADGRLYALDLATGKSVWEYEAGGGFNGSPAIADGRLVIASDDGHVYCFGKKPYMTTDTTKTEVGSYFISNYPPFSQWKAEQLEPVVAAMNAPPAESPLGLYIHIPFCRKRCKFCYFKVFTEKNAGEIENYVSALAREMELVSQLPVMGAAPFPLRLFRRAEPLHFSAPGNSLPRRSPAPQCGLGCTRRR